ncbi:hypothetical protein P167DRAFT_535226 [Morchella conica CCBAS932]|uniref:Uncharacterized protein n=1 Tax=Morchella conica CCBAS932 TaxID=1392247 RepID=A0A3N4L575_9PEZI|nr:hypothetical protein P167DRAFT_535226 [Morchella conica CCBAS932]
MLVLLRCLLVLIPTLYMLSGLAMIVNQTCCLARLTPIPPLGVTVWGQTCKLP